MQRPLSTIIIDDFNGLVSNRGRFPKEPSDALVQTNIRTLRNSELSIRKGLKDVTFTTAHNIGTSAFTDDIVSLYYYDYTTASVVAEDADGHLGTKYIH